MVRQARQGTVRQVPVRLGAAGMAWHDTARCGWAGQGRLGSARHGPVRFDLVWFGSVRQAGLGLVWRGMVWQVKVGFGRFG